jgi:hypothetical protein
MTQYIDSLKLYSFKTIKASYPLFQARIYDVLKELTPTRLRFELDQQTDKFNWNELDGNTSCLIANVLSDLLDDPKLIITQHDMLISWVRIKELLWTGDLLKQGLIQEKIENDGSVIYETETEPHPPQVHVRRKWGRVKKGLSE